ncbi:MAG: hypothetical protein MRZ62_06675, partial [Brachyspira sp.]|nr:hypothetical protein [Brachyspira sp.]
ASQMYVGNPSIGAKENKEGIQFDRNSSTSKVIGLTPIFCIWSGEENTDNESYGRLFMETAVYYTYGSCAYRNRSGPRAICLAN